MEVNQAGALGKTLKTAGTKGVFTEYRTLFLSGNMMWKE